MALNLQIAALRDGAASVTVNGQSREMELG